MSVKTKYLASTDSYFHAYNRGVDHARIFFSPDDYQGFLRRLRFGPLPENAAAPFQKDDARIEARDNIEIIAYCLMPNHYHFILHQLAANVISELIGRACNGYVKAVNIRLGRSGHLFEGKYKMRLVGDNRDLLHLSRYIHLNPVRAGLVMKPEDWPYSSCRDYYAESVHSFVHPDVVLEELGGRDCYREFVESYTEEDKGYIEKCLIG